MKHQIVIILSIITFILGCVDFEQKTKQAVDDGVMQASSMLTDSIAFHKKEFNYSYNKVLGKTSDTFMYNKIKGFQISVIATSNYIDSLRNEVDKLNINDLKNVERIKSIFVSGNISDSLYNKLNSAIIYADDLAASETSKELIKDIGDNILIQRNRTKFKKDNFSLNSSMGVSWLLSGMQIELFKAATISLNTI